MTTSEGANLFPHPILFVGVYMCVFVYNGLMYHVLNTSSRLKRLAAIFEVQVVSVNLLEFLQIMELLVFTMLECCVITLKGLLNFIRES
jgi:hypothetical protein